MSEENVEQVRARYEQSARGDFTPIEKAPDDFEFVASHNVPDAGTYRGEAARRWMKAWVESFDGLTMEAIEIIDVGDKVFAAFVQRGRPRGGQTEVESRWWSVDTFREGVSARTEIFADRASKPPGCGSSPPEAALESGSPESMINVRRIERTAADERPSRISSEAPSAHSDS